MSLIKVQQSERAGSDEQRVQGASPSMSKREAEDKPSSKNGIEQDEEIFHNRGLEVWLERRQQWRSEGSSEDAQREQEESRKRKRSYTPTVTVEQLLSFQPLPHPVPLEEAVELLAELWECEEPF